MWCIHVWGGCVQSRLCVEGQCDLRVFSTTPPYSLEIGSLSEPGIVWWPTSASDVLSPLQPLPCPALLAPTELQAHRATLSACLFSLIFLCKGWLFFFLLVKGARTHPSYFLPSLCHPFRLFLLPPFFCREGKTCRTFTAVIGAPGP